MKSKLQCYVELNENDRVKFLQYKCLNCGNFEEISTDNENFKLEKFLKIYEKNSKHLFNFTCKRCNLQTKNIDQKSEPLTP